MTATGEYVSRLHHVGYVVENLERAAHHFARAYGIGPFLIVPLAKFEVLEFQGSECTWEHSIALAAWGDIRLEIEEVGVLDPPELARLLGRPTRLSHFCYRVADLEAETERLAGQGIVPFLHAKGGPVRFTLFADPAQPVHVEVMRDDPVLREMDEAIAAAARGWDGRDPIRPRPVPH